MNTRAFTLIELMVALTLLFVILWLTYVPYAYQWKKLAVKQAGKELSQSLYEARNLAVSGTASGSNLSVWLYINTDASTRHQLSFYGYPYESIIIDPTLWILLETRPLPVGVEIRAIQWQDNALFLFEAISGSGSYIYLDSVGTPERFSEDILSIAYAFSDADESSPLYTTLKYFTQTNIVDY